MTTSLLSPSHHLPTTRSNTVVGVSKSFPVAKSPSAITAVAQARLANREFTSTPKKNNVLPTGRVLAVVVAIFVLIFATAFVLAAFGEGADGSTSLPGLDSLMQILSSAYLGN